MNFQELGLTLQREREKMGLSIDAVMEATKISRINIEALEGGDRSMLPHPVYTKGFVKSYARFLGLDADELAMVVDREYQGDSDEVEDVSYDVSPAAERAFQDKDAPVDKKRSIWPTIIVFLVLVAGAVGTLVVLSQDGDQPNESAVQSSEPTESDVPSATPEPESSQEAMSDSAGEDENLPATEETESEAVASDNTAENLIASDDMNDTSSAQQTVKEDESPAPATSDTQEKQLYDHVLIIRATTEKGCWIGVWRGNETDMARDFVLKQGEPLRLMFNNPRRIRIGNASGVTVTYNGKPYSLDDAKGNIQTLKFGMD